LAAVYAVATAVPIDTDEAINIIELNRYGSIQASACESLPFDYANDEFLQSIEATYDEFTMRKIVFTTSLGTVLSAGESTSTSETETITFSQESQPVGFYGLEG